MPEKKKLTTAEVASKRFTPVRMREGYSTDEVDEFLEAVEDTIEAYEEDLEKITAAYNELKSRPVPAPQPAHDTGALSSMQAELARARRAATDAEKSRDALLGQLETLGNQLIEARKAAEDARANAASSNSIDPSQLDMSSATGIIARMLENAAKNHDDLVAQGESEAMRLRDEAAEEANRMLAEAEAAKSEAYKNLEAREAELRRAVENLELIEKNSREELTRTYQAALAELSK